MKSDVDEKKSHETEMKYIAAKNVIDKKDEEIKMLIDKLKNAEEYIEL